MTNGWDIDQWRRELEEWRRSQEMPEPKSRPYSEMLQPPPFPELATRPSPVFPSRPPVPPDWLEPQEVPVEAMPRGWLQTFKDITSWTAQFGEWMRPEFLRGAGEVRLPTTADIEKMSPLEQLQTSAQGEEIPILKVTPPPIEDINSALAHMNWASATHKSDSAWDKEWRATYADIVDRLNEVATGEVNDRRVSSAISELFWDIRADREAANKTLAGRFLSELSPKEREFVGQMQYAVNGYQEIIDLLLPLVLPETRSGLEKEFSKEYKEIYTKERFAPEKPWWQIPPLQAIISKGEWMRPEFLRGGGELKLPTAAEIEKMSPLEQQFMAGWGDVIATGGGALQWIGQERLGQNLREIAEPLRETPFPEMPELGWKSAVDPKFWNSLPSVLARTTPFALSLIPAMIAGYAGGAYVGGALGLSALWTTILGAIGATALSRPMESALEAGAIYNEALLGNKSPEQASEQANKVFLNNLKLAGWDVTQIAAAFLPTPARLAASPFLKIAMVGGKVTVTGLSEAGEEAVQEIFQKQAAGEPVVLDQEMKIAMLVGGIMGGGMGAAGAAFTTLQETIVKAMPPDTKADFDAKVSARVDKGFPLDKAVLMSLDEMAQTPQGKQIITEAVQQVQKEDAERQIQASKARQEGVIPTAITPRGPITPEVTTQVKLPSGTTAEIIETEPGRIWEIRVRGERAGELIENFGKVTVFGGGESFEVSNREEGFLKLQQLAGEQEQGILRRPPIAIPVTPEVTKPVFIVDTEGKIARVTKWDTEGNPIVIYPGKSGGIEERTGLPFQYKPEEGWRPVSVADFSRTIRPSTSAEMIDLRMWRDEFTRQPVSPFKRPPGRHEVPVFGEPGAIPEPVSPEVAKAGRRRVIEERIRRGEPVPPKLLAEFPDLLAIPTAEAGMPEAGLQPSMLPEAPRVEAVTLTQDQIRLVQRKDEIIKLLATPHEKLPKGIKKIALRQELAEVKAKLKPVEAKLRQQIMAGVKAQGLGIRQKEALFKQVGGSRHLSEIPIEKLPAVLEAVRRARPVKIKGKKVITPKTETLIQEMKQEAMDKGFLTQEGYEEILRGLKLRADKYTNANDFITETDGTAIIREIRNRLILGPLGELKFGTPTIVSALTSDVYYAQVLGLHPIVNELITGKVNSDLAIRAMAQAVHKKLNQANRAWGVSQIESARDKIAGIPSRGSVELRNLLDKYEELPAEVTKSLTPKQIEFFNWFRNFNRTIIGAENAVRRTLEMPEIPYREAYVRHVPDEMAREIIEGLHPLPPSLEYWSRRLVSKRVFNPMELHRQLSDDLEALYTRDLERATMDMVRIGMKEIHLNQPLRAFNERMSALTDKMPATTQEWVRSFVNIRIKGQPTNLDASMNRLVTDSGIGGVINDVLRPYRLSLGRAPVTKMTELFGRGVMTAVLAAPRPMLARLIIRNLFQATQNLALHNPISLAKGYLTPVVLNVGNPELLTLNRLKVESPFLRAYTGLEELPSDVMSKVEKIALAPYQLSGVFNAYRAFDVAYWDYLPFITKPKYKGLGWADPQRTYTEAKGFLYPSEFKALMEEGELAARATQYEYIGVGMPAIFRNRTLIPLTRLQSWWMNHIFMFNREAANRLLTGRTRLGRGLPWTSRINYLTYLVVGGAILTGMGYSSSYLWKTLPHNLSPVSQFMLGLWSYGTATYDWQKESAKREIFGSWKAMVPGALTFDEFQKLWSGEMPLWRIFFYGTEEGGPPPHTPTWGIINRAPAESRKIAIRDIEAAMALLGTEQTVDLPEPSYQINLQTGQWEKITEKTYIYRMEDLGQAIRTATLKLEAKDITEENGFSPLATLYKKSMPFIDAYYRIPSNQRQSFLGQDTPESIWAGAYLVLWGRLSYSGWVQDNPKTLGVVEQLRRQYNIPRNAIYGLGE